MRNLRFIFWLAVLIAYPCSMLAQSSGPTPPPPPTCSQSIAGQLYTNTGTSPATVYTCSYYNLTWQWVVNPSYGGVLYYPTLPSTCSGALPVFLSGWPTTTMYLCVSGFPEPLTGGGAVSSLTTTGTSGAATLASGVLNIPQYQGSLTLTTAGSSGPATLSGNTLNIPQYSGGGSMTWPSSPVTRSTPARLHGAQRISQTVELQSQHLSPYLSPPPAEMPEYLVWHRTLPIPRSGPASSTC